MIPTLLKRTVMTSGGAPPRHVLLQELSEKHPHLDKTLLHQQVLLEERHRAKWLLSHATSSIFSPKCTGKAFISADGLIRACDCCAELLKIKTLRTAIKRPLPTIANTKFVPKAYRNELLGDAFLRHSDVRDLFEVVGHMLSSTFLAIVLTLLQGNDRWRLIAQRGARCEYKDLSLILGVLEAILDTSERKEQGKGLQNMKYSAEFDEFCTTMAALSPGTYTLFRSEFGGRSPSSMQ